MADNPTNEKGHSETMNHLYKQFNNGVGSFDDLRRLIAEERKILSGLDMKAKDYHQRYGEHKAILGHAEQHEKAMLEKAQRFLAEPKPLPAEDIGIADVKAPPGPVVVFEAKLGR